MVRRKIFLAMLLLGFAGMTGCFEPPVPTAFGPDCAEHTVNGLTVRYCRYNEYCDNGKCVSEGLSPCSGSDGVDAGNRPLVENSNGYGYCLPKYSCENGKCLKMAVSCTDDNYLEVCADKAECINSICVCGNTDKNCADPDNTCCATDGACHHLKSDQNNCGECGHKCDAGYTCYDGRCELACQDDMIICDGNCINPMTDRDFCGASANCLGENAGTRCPPGEVCTDSVCLASCSRKQALCGEGCINPLRDDIYCGARPEGTCDSEDPEDANYRGETCDVDKRCEEGKCVLACGPNQIVCDDECVNPLTDREFCGARGNCDSDDSASDHFKGEKCIGADRCIDGRCQLVCAENKVACNGECINPLDSKSFCGAAIGGTCSSEDAADPNFQGIRCDKGMECVEGKCVVNCAEGMENCGDVCVNLNNNSENCGSCGTKCSETGQNCVNGQCICPEGFTLCSGEGCVWLASTHRTECGSCMAGWGNCDEMPDCETNLITDPQNCGACGQKCSEGQFCNNGECGANCTGELRECVVNSVSTCTSIKTDPDNCGECNHVCPAKTNADAMCSNGSCSYQCSANYTNCGTAGNPDCKNLNIDSENCKGCGIVCSGANVSENQCTDGVCSVKTCASGYADCNSSFADGCEINIKTDPLNCGACNKMCNMGETCMNGVCKCGSGAACTVPDHASRVTCSNAGECVPSCLPGYHAKNGACVADTDTACGGNEVDCTKSGRTCYAGMCMCGGGLCTSGSTCCSGTCVNMNSTSSCGKSCGTLSVCTAPQHGTATCLMGTCGFICNTGYIRSGSTCIPGCNSNSDCASGYTCCNNQCKNLNSPLSCGTTCNNAITCSPVAHGTAQCSNGSCKYLCFVNYCGATCNKFCGVINPDLPIIDPIPIQP